MTIRAKFYVVSKKESFNGLDPDGKPVKLTTIEMSPVSCQHVKNPETGRYDIVPTENTRFWQASPNGSLSLACVNQEAADCYELGKEYYLDFSLAVAPAASAAE